VNTNYARYLSALLLLSFFASLSTARGDDTKTKAGPEPSQARTVSGRVLTPNGKPAAGAKLFALVLKDDRRAEFVSAEQRPVGVADAIGRFSVAVPRIRNDIPFARLVAYVPGFGVDWLDIETAKLAEPLRDQTLQLTPDLAITGRLVTAEGRPVAGVSVELDAIFVPDNEKLDSYLAGWKKRSLDWVPVTRKAWGGALSKIVGPMLTDPDGRFSVRGAGRERIVRNCQVDAVCRNALQLRCQAV